MDSSVHYLLTLTRRIWNASLCHRSTVKHIYNRRPWNYSWFGPSMWTRFVALKSVPILQPKMYSPSDPIEMFSRLQTQIHHVEPSVISGVEPSIPNTPSLAFSTWASAILRLVSAIRKSMVAMSNSCNARRVVRDTWSCTWLRLTRWDRYRTSFIQLLSINYVIHMQDLRQVRAVKYHIFQILGVSCFLSTYHSWVVEF